MAADIERGLVKSSYGYLHYRAAGQGQPIVLLHINQQSSALYLEMIEALAPHMRPIAIDYPSHGMSDHIAQQPAIADYARATIEILDALGIRQTMVLGEATGAGVAVELAGAYPDRVTKAVLVNCPFIEETPVTLPMRRSLAALALAALLGACATPSAPPPVAQTPGCLSAAQVDAWLAAYNGRTPATNPPASMTMADAACTRARLQQRLAAQAGPLISSQAP